MNPPTTENGQSWDLNPVFSPVWRGQHTAKLGWYPEPTLKERCEERADEGWELRKRGRGEAHLRVCGQRRPMDWSGGGAH